VGLDDIAHVWTAFLISYMVGQFVSSFVGRKWGPRVLILGGLGISIGINVIFGFTNSYWTFLGFMIFNGLAQSAGWPGCVGAVGEWLRKKERGSIMGIWSTNYVLGNLVVKSLGGMLLAGMGWRYAFWGCTFLAFGIWWLVFFWQRNRPEDAGLPPIVKTQDEDRTIQASSQVQATFKDYLDLAKSPIVLIMGLTYFFLKFLRYALDSWLPTFLDIQGFDAGRAAYYSGIFDFAGLAGAILTGFALDRLFKGRWDVLCLILSGGMALGYLAVVKFGTTPTALALCFGAVGFMLYGPDTLMAGAAAVQVAGSRNAVAVAGLVNGIGSLGPIFQEEVIGRMVEGKPSDVGIHNVNVMTLGISITLMFMFGLCVWRVQQLRKGKTS
jgi:sugar phosphate permease